MTSRQALANLLQRSPALGALGYAAVMAALVITAWISIANLLAQHADLAAANDILAQLQGRSPASDATAATPGAPHGSPFIAGQTVTVAGAHLLQRVSRAIAEVGGRVLSSQVDLQAARTAPGFISVIINCELDQPGLQHVLYDLEAGMPFLFIDHLEVQAPQSSATEQAARVHVLLSASGQWLEPR